MMQKEPPYDELIEVLRRDWQIEASWDGLRRVWYVGWTDEHVESCAECARGLGAYADSLCDPLKAENAKLRELVRDLWLTGSLCDAIPDMRLQAKGGDWRTMQERVDEALGIEVDDD